MCLFLNLYLYFKYSCIDLEMVHDIINFVGKETASWQKSKVRMHIIDPCDPTLLQIPRIAGALMHGTALF